MMDTVRKHGQTRFFELHFSTTSPAARFETRKAQYLSRRAFNSFIKREIFFVSLPGRGRGRDLIARGKPWAGFKVPWNEAEGSLANQTIVRRGADTTSYPCCNWSWSMKEEERVERGRIEYEGYEGSRSDKSDSLERKKDVSDVFVERQPFRRSPLRLPRGSFFFFFRRNLERKRRRKREREAEEWTKARDLTPSKVYGARNGATSHRAPGIRFFRSFFLLFLPPFVLLRGRIASPNSFHVAHFLVLFATFFFPFLFGFLSTKKVSKSLHPYIIPGSLTIAFPPLFKALWKKGERTIEGTPRRKTQEERRSFCLLESLPLLLLLRQIKKASLYFCSNDDPRKHRRRERERDEREERRSALVWILEWKFGK